MRYSRPYRLIRQKRKNGVIWYYLLRGERTKHTTGETTKKRAAEYVDKLLGAPDGARTALGDLAGGFFAWDGDWATRQRQNGRRLSEHQAGSRQAHVENWILPALGRYLLADLTPVAIERWLGRIDRANGTRNDILNTLRIVLRDAKRQGLLAHNPCADVEPLGRVYRHRDALSLEELRVLFPRTRDELVGVWGSGRTAVAYLLMATTGMRIGEVCALLWQHVRADIPAVMIIQAVKRGGGIGPPKGGKPRAALLSPRALEALAWWQAETPYPAAADYVVPSKRGGYGHPKSVGVYWSAAATRAGIQTAGRFLGAHALRHTYETIRRGTIPEAELQYMVGHRSDAMADRYDHRTPEERALQIVKAVRLEEW